MSNHSICFSGKIRKLSTENRILSKATQLKQMLIYPINSKTMTLNNKFKFVVCLFVLNVIVKW